VNTPMVNWAMALRRAVANSVRNKEVDELMTLIIPDRDRPQRDDLIWAMPLTKERFNKWVGLSTLHKLITPKLYGNMRYMTRVESDGDGRDGRSVMTLIMLPTDQHTDDDVMQACAYLRLVKEHTCRIYVVRQEEEP
jgi:hypothetical protein